MVLYHRIVLDSAEEHPVQCDVLVVVKKVLAYDLGLGVAEYLR